MAAQEAKYKVGEPVHFEDLGAGIVVCYDRVEPEPTVVHGREVPENVQEFARGLGVEVRVAMLPGEVVVYVLGEPLKWVCFYQAKASRVGEE